MKRVSAIAIITLAVTIGVLSVSAYTLSSYSLTKVGQYDVGNPEKTAYKYPTVVWTNHSVDSDSEISITLSKKGLFGYTVLSRTSKWTKGISNYTFKFSSQKTGTYRANVIFNDSKDNKAISGQYYLTSTE